MAEDSISQPPPGRHVDPDTGAWMRGDSEETARIELSELGARIEAHFKRLPEFTPEIEVLGVQVMPEHLHGVLRVTREMKKPLGEQLRGFKMAAADHGAVLVSPCISPGEKKMTCIDACVLNRIAQLLAGDGAVEINYKGARLGDVDSLVRRAVA